MDVEDVAASEGRLYLLFLRFPVLGLVFTTGKSGLYS